MHYLKVCLQIVCEQPVCEPAARRAIRRRWSRQSLRVKMPFLKKRLESGAARAVGVLGMAAGGAVATVGAAATVAAATTTAVGSVVHEGARRGGDVVEYNMRPTGPSPASTSSL